MAVGMTMDVPGRTKEFYDSVMETLEWDTTGLPEGLISHYAGASGDDWFVFDVWESPEHFNRFAQELLVPAMQATGQELPQIEPRFIPIHREDHARERV